MSESSSATSATVFGTSSGTSDEGDTNSTDYSFLGAPTSTPNPKLNKTSQNTKNTQQVGDDNSFYSVAPRAIRSGYFYLNDADTKGDRFHTGSSSPDGRPHICLFRLDVTHDSQEVSVTADAYAKIKRTTVVVYIPEESNVDVCNSITLDSVPYFRNTMDCAELSPLQVAVFYETGRNEMINRTADFLHALQESRVELRSSKRLAMKETAITATKSPAPEFLTKDKLKEEAKKHITFIYTTGMPHSTSISMTEVEKTIHMFTPDADKQDFAYWFHIYLTLIKFNLFASSSLSALILTIAKGKSERVKEEVLFLETQIFGDKEIGTKDPSTFKEIAKILHVQESVQQQMIDVTKCKIDFECFNLWDFSRTDFHRELAVSAIDIAKKLSLVVMNNYKSLATIQRDEFYSYTLRGAAARIIEAAKPQSAPSGILVIVGTQLHAIMSVRLQEHFLRTTDSTFMHLIFDSSTGWISTEFASIFESLQRKSSVLHSTVILSVKGSKYISSMKVPSHQFYDIWKKLGCPQLKDIYSLFSKYIENDGLTKEQRYQQVIKSLF